MFVSYCVAQAKLINDTILGYQNCKVGRDWYVKQGRYYTTEPDYEPKAGDAFFFASATAPSRVPHRGIVAAYDLIEKVVYTEEYLNRKQAIDNYQ